MKTISTLIVAVLVAGMVRVSPAAGDTDVSPLLEKQSKAVVMVRGVRSSKGGEQRRFESLGLVVRDGRMVIVSGLPKNADKMTASLEGDEEVPLSYVMRDDDLDLAILKIEPKADEKSPFSNVSLAEAVSMPLIGTPVTIIDRKASFRYGPRIGFSEVMGVFDQPRKLFGISEADARGPVFDTKGRFLGLGMRHGEKFGWPCGDGMLTVLPASEILRFADQADPREGDGGEEKGAPPKESTGSVADAPSSARTVLGQYQDALVRIAAVVRVEVESAMAGGKQENESEVELGGLVVDTSGLVITDLFSLDPSVRIREMLAEQMKNLPEALREQLGEIKIDFDVSDLKVIMADGTELEAELTVKDEQSGIAVIQVKELGGRDLSVVDVRATAPTPDPFEQVILLNRTGKDLHLAPVARRGRVSTVKGGARIRLSVEGGHCFDSVFSPSGQFIGYEVHQMAVDGPRVSMDHGVVHSRDIARTVYGQKGKRNKADWLSDDEKASRASELSAQFAPAVVTITASASMEQGGREMSKTATGLVVRRDGVVLASLRELCYAGNRALEDLKNVRILTADGEELKGELFLKDEDLDVALVRISADELKDKKVELTALDLEGGKSAPSVGQPVVFLSRRTSGVLRDKVLGLIGDVTCVTDKPSRLIGVTMDDVPGALFSLEGELIGIQLITKFRCQACDGTHHAAAVIPCEELSRLLK